MTILMEGLRTRVAKTDVFRVHTSTYEVTLDIALNAAFNLKAARYGNEWDTSSSVDKVEPIDLIHAG